MLDEAVISSTSSAKSIDTRPKTVTTAIAYDALQALDELADGDVLEITTEAFEPIEGDLRSWCRMSGNRFVTTQRASAT